MDDTAKYDRITVGLHRRAREAMHRLIEETGLTKTDLVSRALQLYGLWSEAEAEGGTWTLTDKDGRTTQVRLF